MFYVDNKTQYFLVPMCSKKGHRFKTVLEKRQMTAMGKWDNLDNWVKMYLSQDHAVYVA